MSNEEVDNLGTGRFLDFVLFKGLAQSSRDETITRVCQRRFAVFLQKIFDLGGVAVPFLDDLLSIRKFPYLRFYFLIVFQ